MHTRDQLVSLVRDAVRGFMVGGKTGRDQLQGMIASHLAANGLAADTEDTRQFLRSGMPVWRDKGSLSIEATPGRRRIDIVVYSGDSPVALIETESDLDDLRTTGVSRRSGHYDVFSISRSGAGTYYDSYKSLERMAAAAFYWTRHRETGIYPTPQDGPALLEAVCTDAPESQNPSGLAIILVSSRCRAQDPVILSRRLATLSADLVCVSNTSNT